MKEKKTVRKLYWSTLESIRSWRNLIEDYFEQVRILLLLMKKTKQTSSLIDRQASKKMLFISFYSPPYPSYLGTQRLTKFLKYWSRKDWKITLLTTSPEPDAPLDTANELLNTNVEIKRIPATRMKSRFLGSRQFVPDSYIHWIKPAIDAANKIITSERPSVIVATVPPYSNAIAATICANKHDLPLVIDFRDPWTCIDLVWVIRNKFLRYINALIERRVLKLSQLILISDELDYLSTYFPNGERWRSKVKSITNGYDEEDFNNASLNKDNLFNISYVGSIYDEETLLNIINPILEWGKNHPEDMKLVKFVYAGKSQYFNKDTLLPCKLENHGVLAHDKAIQLRFNSQVQLLSLPKYIKPHVYSGKIFEMIRTPAPILAIINPISSPAKLIESTQTGFVTSPEEINKSADFLKKEFELWKEGKTNYAPNKYSISQFSRDKLAESALLAIDKLIQE